MILFQEAEKNNFTTEDLEIAFEHCENENPIVWLKNNYKNIIDTVVTLATNYGRECKENSVGTVSQLEARKSLHASKGVIWAAVNDCVENRQKKVIYGFIK